MSDHESAEIRYTESVAGVEADALAGGFFVGWPNPPTPATHLALLRGSSHVVLALDAQSGQVVGFITVVSDGVLTAFIPLLEVLPAWQGRHRRRTGCAHAGTPARIVRGGFALR